jgi:hypothetical protein
MRPVIDTRREVRDAKTMVRVSNAYNWVAWGMLAAVVVVVVVVSISLGR